MPTTLRPSDRLPNAHGCLEYARPHGDALILRGWMVDEGGAFESVSARVGGTEVALGQRIDRADLEGPLAHVAGVRDAGFHVELPLGLVEARGRLEFELVGARGGMARGALWGGWLRSAETRPLPPAHLMERVAHTQLDYLFRTGGQKCALDFVRAAGRVRADLRFARVLDWGCGCGRVTAHLSELLPESRITGADLDAEAVTWAGRELSGATFARCGMEPPLPFERGAFDLVLAGSVFTHLAAERQHAWLAELRRVLAPGGLLLATTLGEFALRMRETDARRAARLADTGIDDQLHDATLDAVVSADYYRATWQSAAWTEANWGRHLCVLGHEVAGFENLQDLWFLQRDERP